MIKKYLFAFVIILGLQTSIAFAATPILSIVPSGDGDSSTINISGADPTSAVILNYSAASDSSAKIMNIGSTNTSGAFSMSIKATSFNINPQGVVHVTVNGYSSNEVSWSSGYSTGTVNTNVVNTTSTDNSNSGTGGPALNPTSLSMIQGQTSTVTISGGTQPYTSYIDDSYGYVRQSITGNTLNVVALQNGSTKINVCSTGAGCTWLNVSVGGNTSTVSTTSITLSQSNVTLSVGQSYSVSLSGSGSYYISQSSNTTVATTVISGNMVNITGNSVGSNNVVICQSSTQCTILYITVSASPVTTNTSASSITANHIIFIGQTIMMKLSGGSGYYLQSNISTPFSAVLYNDTLFITGITNGSNSVSVCTSSTNCMTVFVTVDNNTNPAVTIPVTITPVVSPSTTVTGCTNGSVYSATTGQPCPVTNSTVTTSTATVTTSSYVFTSQLKYGDNGDEVLQLQKVLDKLGLLHATPNGHFGMATEEAVKKYQAKYGLEQVGYVGPSTRAHLNQE